MAKRKSKQLELADYFMQNRMISGHGGPRKGAGAKRSIRGPGRYRRRAPFKGLIPAHLTLRVAEGIPSLRRQSLILEARKAFAGGSERGDFWLVEYSIQDDHLHLHLHLHLIVEAESQDALSRGMMSISSRFARAVNRIFQRTGRVIDGRYHVEFLTSPTQVRNALRYVLLNIRKHVVQRKGFAPPVQIDAASSGSQFDGWQPSPEVEAVKAAGREEVGVAAAVSWLLRRGWRQLGLIPLSAVPG